MTRDDPIVTNADTPPGRAAGLPSWAALLNLAPERRGEVHIHLIGIGGAGLSAIAALLLDMGYAISGSDQRPNAATDELAARGATFFRGHQAANVAGADLVVVSSAIPENNPEVAAAEAAGIPILRRGEFLGPLMEGRHGIGVAGAHGKTTTTSLIAIALLRAGLDPSFIIGGQLSVGPAEGFATSVIGARAGQGPFVIEADEYDRMFLGLRLEVAVVTNVEWDHVDCYPTPQTFADAFRAFAALIPAWGLLLVCADDPGALALRDAAAPGVRVLTYGLSPEADWQAHDLRPNDLGGFDAEIWVRDAQGSPSRKAADLRLSIPGRHNVRNALAALAVADWHGIPPRRAAVMLRDFHGAGRRFELLGEEGGVTVIDDYAHHPTEIAATLSAAHMRYPSRRIWAVFQPHTYSRTRALLDGFAASLDDADRVIVLDIYPAREKIDLGMHSSQLVERMDPERTVYIGGIEDAARRLLDQVEPDDVVITMSAGDGNRAGQLLLEGLRLRAGTSGQQGGGA
jgi:UDP-N-acetylmuramate--alanine ligase